MNDEFTQQHLRRMRYSELLAEMMDGIEERQQTEAGRAYLASNAQRIASAILFARQQAQRELLADMGRKPAGTSQD